MNRVNKRASDKVFDSRRINDAAADAQRAVDELHEYRYEIGGVAKLLAPSAKRGGRGTISITTNADAVRNNAHVDIFKVETNPSAKQRLEEFYSDYANTELKIVGVRCTYNGSYSESIADPTPNRGWGERNSYDMSSTYAPSGWVINLDVVDNSIADSRRIKDADEADTDTDTDDVIDGLLIITFKDGSEDDGLKAVQEHANEQGDGYETYEVKEQDGKVGVDMCAQTSDPNSFVKELLKAWGVLDAVADVDFKKSDLMEEAEQQEEVSDSRKITDSTYGTSFTLTNPVNDYNAALDYLQADDMTQYLNNDLNYLGLSHLEGKIKEIKWVLEDEQTGYIVLYTTEPLAQEDLDKISEWISGQCSDGLGEGFEQQPFAEVRYYDEDDYNDEYGYNDYDTDMASFDWETNDYKLKLYDSARVKDGCGEDAETVGKVNNTDILRDNKNGGVYVWVNGKKKKFSTKKDAEEYIKKTYNEDGTPKK